jgi:hypothetical protein
MILAIRWALKISNKLQGFLLNAMRIFGKRWTKTIADTFHGIQLKTLLVGSLFTRKSFAKREKSFKSSERRRLKPRDRDKLRRKLPDLQRRRDLEKRLRRMQRKKLNE